MQRIDKIAVRKLAHAGATACFAALGTFTVATGQNSPQAAPAAPGVAATPVTQPSPVEQPTQVGQTAPASPTSSVVQPPAPQGSPTSPSLNNGSPGQPPPVNVASPSTPSAQPYQTAPSQPTGAQPTGGFYPAPPYPTQSGMTQAPPSQPQFGQPEYAQPTYGQPGYPQAAYGQPAYPQPMLGTAPPRAHPIRDLFAGTISALLQGISGGLVGSVSQGVVGSITSWFDRKRQNVAMQYGTPMANPAMAASPSTVPYPPSASNATMGQYPAPTASTTPYTDPSATYPYGAQTAPTSGYLTQAQYGSNPGSAGSAYATSTYQVYDPSTGQLANSGSNPYAAASVGYNGTLYAGIAYEVHAFGAGGTSLPVNAATYVFHTGDRFNVYIRPSMPGRLDVYNINALGKQTQIDSVSTAAGQLITLGPYEFTATTGDESLHLVLSPCSSATLLASTRDIVNVSGSLPAAGGIPLQSCGAPLTRGIAGFETRDIQKVAVDGTTSFALDPIAQAELSSGQVAPREVTIAFHHL